MQGLTIIVAGADEERFRSALEVAAANAALDRTTRVFLQGAAASLLQPLAAGVDEPKDVIGVPTLAQLLEEALALGASVTVCQSGLALAGMRADRLPEGVETGGLVELLASGRNHQLLMA
jgi:predicted peroxiredoxin